MKISCIQMDMRLGEVDCNFARAQALIRSAEIGRASCRERV